MEFTTKKLPASIGKWGMILTVVGAIMAGAAFAVDSHRAMFGYLWMYMFLVSIGVGSLALVALEYLVEPTGVPHSEESPSFSQLL